MKNRLGILSLVVGSSFVLSACIPAADTPVPVTTWYVDADSDGYGDINDVGTASTHQPAGYVGNNSDCDDSAAAINPDGLETLNTLDDNCDDVIDEGFTTYYKDSDADNYGNPLRSHDGKPDDSYVLDNTDCDDNDDTIAPNATEAFNLKDDDCDDSVDEDFSFVTYTGNYSEGADLAAWTKYSSQIPPYDSLYPMQVFRFGVGTHTVSGSGRLFSQSFSDNDYDSFLVTLPIELQITNVTFSVPSLPTNISAAEPGMFKGIRFYQGNSSFAGFLVTNSSRSDSYTTPITMDHLYDSVTFSCCGGGGTTTSGGTAYSYSVSFTVEQIAGTCSGDYDCDSIDNLDDNCPFDANTTQEDADFDGVGDSCEV